MDSTSLEWKDLVKNGNFSEGCNGERRFTVLREK
ncbi:hypothetical protein A2U01_0093268, partial [Trifolium medium]|nr:hypothetical protein [Trifolium medium]